jgi:hypothetical protein
MNNQIEEQPAQKFDAENMEAFMDFGERERAATYYKQMQQLKEESLCKFCDKMIT